VLQVSGYIYIGNANHPSPHTVIFDVVEYHLANFLLNQRGNARNTASCRHKAPLITVPDRFQDFLVVAYRNFPKSEIFVTSLNRDIQV
jgi:hypothetical protein